MTRRLPALALALLFALPAAAEPRQYRLDPAGSSVSFTYVLNGVPGQGSMPIAAADLAIDFADIARSSAQVALDVSGAKTDTVFVTQALKSRQVLDAGSHPVIRFVSDAFSGSIRDGAQIRGDVTIRGVTRPMTLTARVYRRQGSAAGDLSRLSVLLTGSVNRSEFGASGYADLVADRVDLRILVRLDAV